MGPRQRYKLSIMVEASKRARPWRQDVRSEAMKWVDRPIDGPVEMILHFYMPRPQIVPAKRRGYPTTRPDLDKLARCICDALDGLAYYDDSQVVRLIITKCYAADGPGVSINIVGLCGMQE